MSAPDELVSAWLTLPDLAERLHLDVTKVRTLVRDRSIVGMKRGERNTFQVPEAFLVAAEGDGEQVLATLRGTIMLLDDQRFTDEEILRWLFTVEESMSTTPIDALRAGRRAEVRRVAQALAM